jgi:hypothetical protein
VASSIENPERADRGNGREAVHSAPFHGGFGDELGERLDVIVGQVVRNVAGIDGQPPLEHGLELELKWRTSPSSRRWCVVASLHRDLRQVTS